MRILPVMDLKGGKVVQAIGGQREKYQPVRSRLVENAEPETIARAFAVQCGFSDVYIADLDAIAGADPNWDVYQRIALNGLQLILDAGLSTVESVMRLEESSRRLRDPLTAVVASESVRERSILSAALETFGPARAIFSLDLRAGKPLGAQPTWMTALPREIAAEVVAVGYRRLIVLDLMAVGTSNGPVTLELCKELHSDYPSLEIISGGGIRHSGDIQALCDVGCKRVLVASALHDGRLAQSGSLYH